MTTNPRIDAAIKGAVPGVIHAARAEARKGVLRPQSTRDVAEVLLVAILETAKLAPGLTAQDRATIAGAIAKARTLIAKLPEGAGQAQKAPARAIFMGGPAQKRTR
jgi:hypothetical protein